MAKVLKVKLVRSGIGRAETQKRTLRGMGLTKMGKVVVLPNTPTFRGMVAKVIHLVEIRETESSDNMGTKNR